MPEPLIREAATGDFAAIAAHRWDWVMQSHQESSDLTRAEFIDVFVEWVLAHESTHRCFIAERAGEVIGMAWLAITPRVPSPRAVRRLSADIQSVYVVPTERGAGLGGSLVAALVAVANQLGIERVTVHSSDRAVTVYERAGFRSSPKLLEQYLDAAVQ